MPIKTSDRFTLEGVLARGPRDELLLHGDHGGTVELDAIVHVDDFGRRIKVVGWWGDHGMFVARTYERASV